MIKIWNGQPFFKIHWWWFWNHGSFKKDAEYWISQFNGLSKTITIHKWSFGNHVEYMDFYIYKGDKFYDSGFLDFWIFQKEINQYKYFPSKSGHVFHTMKNYVLSKIKRYIWYNLLNSRFEESEPNFSQGLEIVVLERFG